MLRFSPIGLAWRRPPPTAPLNMGAGFAVYCRPGHGSRVVEVARELNLDALVAGVVEQGPRQVVIEPLGVTFAGDQLALAPDSERAR